MLFLITISGDVHYYSTLASLIIYECVGVKSTPGDFGIWVPSLSNKSFLDESIEPYSGITTFTESDTSPATAQLKPKSQILTEQSSLSNILAGLRSRWIILPECMKWTPSKRL